MSTSKRAWDEGHRGPNPLFAGWTPGRPTRREPAWRTWRPAGLGRDEHEALDLIAAGT